MPKKFQGFGECRVGGCKRYCYYLKIPKRQYKLILEYKRGKLALHFLDNAAKICSYELKIQENTEIKHVFQPKSFFHQSIFLHTRCINAFKIALWFARYTHVCRRGSVPIDPRCHCQQLTTFKELMMSCEKFWICSFLSIFLMEMGRNFPNTAIFYFWPKVMLLLNPFRAGILWKIVNKKQGRNLTLNGYISKNRANPESKRK